MMVLMVVVKGDCDMLCDVTDMERMPLVLVDE